MHFELGLLGSAQSYVEVFGSVQKDLENEDFCETEICELSEKFT